MKRLGAWGSIHAEMGVIGAVLLAAELTFWHIHTLPPTRDLIESAVRRFEESNPSHKVVVNAIKNDDFKLKIEVAMAGGRRPDVFHTWGGGPLRLFARAGKVLDITPYFTGEWKESMVESALSFCTFDGKVYAVPADIGVVLFWYNTEIFDQYGLEVPKSWEALIKVVKALKERGVTPISLGMAQSWPGAFFYIYLANRIGGSEPFIRAVEGEGSFTHPSFVEAGEKIVELVKLGAFPADFLSMKYDESRRRFFSGYCAMTLMGTWLIAHCTREAPEFLDKLDCFPFPSVEGGLGDPLVVVGGTNSAYAVSSSCENPELAVELVKELTSKRSAEQWAKAGRIPAVKGVIEEGKVPAQTFKAFQLLSKASAIQLYYDQYLEPKLAEKHKETVKALFALRMSPREVGLRMDEVVSERRGKPLKEKGIGKSHVFLLLVVLAIFVVMVLARKLLRSK